MARRRSAFALTALALAALAAPALGQSGKPKPRPRTTVVSQLSVDDLPKDSLPPPLDDAKKPALSFADAQDLADLRVVPSSPADLARWKARRGDDWLTVRLEPTGTAWGTVGFTQNQATHFSQRAVNANCSTSPQHAYYTQPKALRWERLSIGDDGSATLEVTDGWFDPRSCKVKVERRQMTKPRAVALRDGLPLAWALRGDDSITLMFPPDSNVVSDGAAPGSAPLSGAVTRVVLPLRRGSASTAIAEVHPSALAPFLQAVAARSGSRAPLPPITSSTTVGVDVLQTVSDEAPSIVVRSVAAF